MPRPHLAIIIPAYNEQERLGPTLARIAEYARTLDFDTEIWVVNDGSADDTAKLVKCVAESEPLVHLLDCEQNQGKGAAVRRGMLEIDAEWLLMSDADLATPIEELDKLWPLVGEATPIAIGSRPLKESELEVRQPWYREMMGRAFNLAVRTLGIKGIADTQCGFKLYRQDVARDIFSRSKIDGFGFDFEVLMIARDLGYNIAEVPIRWQHKEGSKVNLLRDGVRMLRELMLLRLAGRARRISPRTRGQ
ncbi:MAG TPA: glycosyltransferase family 2 protein [Fimbriimonadaceae bacterium]|nr:glycosyl transferase [Armatimonadota bacterium]HRD30713.1 glycosyltransferase family 2 protein [Fimbriimonadaceae bacterium]HRE94684.1 glycosyltransferase family 2 protein [Fimbriimonadaceae bacterium]HRI74562.1 glycosyltransferase family 2 protein [Fimbriimonadaceae bacterium]